MIRKLINKLFIEVPETQSLSDIAAKEKEQNFTPCPSDSLSHRVLPEA